MVRPGFGETPRCRKAGRQAQDHYRRPQEAPGTARYSSTDDGYINCSIRAELGKQFLLLDRELDSTTSIRHYMDENTGGSLLFANEEWRP